jgi:hypothetical protein
MAWEKRGGRAYFYRSVREQGRVKKLYYGNGPVARFAAGVDARCRAERKCAEDARRSRRDQLDTALTLTEALTRGCELVAAATLLVAGYHRPARHGWRLWRDGRRKLREGRRARQDRP